MTLERIAELAGTSISTVSKAFAGSREISAYTKERIFAIAKETGCFEKYYKQPPSRPLIGLLFPEVESEYYARAIGMLEHEITARGADAVVVFSHFDPEDTARLFSELAYRIKADGVILAGSGMLIKNPDEIPLVSYSSAPSCPMNADKVTVDMQGGILELVRLLKEYGYRRIGFIGERLTGGTLATLKEAIRSHGLHVYQKYIVETDARFTDAGAQGFEELVRRGDLPEVIVAAYDYIAYGAMKQARLGGYRIPDDISFVGIDDLSTAEYIETPLTSLHTHVEDVTKTLVDLVFKRIENRHHRERREITIPVTICLRSSLGKKSSE